MYFSVLRTRGKKNQAAKWNFKFLINRQKVGNRGTEILVRDFIGGPGPCTGFPPPPPSQDTRSPLLYISCNMVLL